MLTVLLGFTRSIVSLPFDKHYKCRKTGTI
jgi:hypothetical protein